MDNMNTMLNAKLPPDKPQTTTSLQKLLNSNCFCDELAAGNNNLPCSSSHDTSGRNKISIISDIKLNHADDSQSNNSFYNQNMSRNLQDVSNTSMESLSNISFCSKDEFNNTQILNSKPMEYDDLMDSASQRDDGLTQTIKRKRSDDIKVDLTTFPYQIKSHAKPIVNTQNRFSIFSEIEIEEEHNIPKNAKSKTDTVKDNSFCPPIFLFNVNIKHLVDQLNEKKVIFKIVNKNKHKSKLYLKDAAAHSEMMQLLRERKIESYSYTPKELKRTNVVLRGLYFKTDLNEIKNEIDSLVPNTVDTVQKFSTNYSRKNNLETGLFLITLTSGKNLNEITGIRYLLNQRVSWEPPKSKLKEIQCWRCQKWGHMSRNCNRPYKCVKCEESHAPGECKFVSSRENLPYCVNCNKRGHPSSFRGCPEYIDYIEMKENIKISAGKQKQKVLSNVASAINTSNFVQKDRSFASVLHNVASDKNVKAKKIPTYIQEFLKIAQSLCQQEPLTLEGKIEKFMRSYKSMTKEVARSQCMNIMDEINMAYGP